MFFFFDCGTIQFKSTLSYLFGKYIWIHYVTAPPRPRGPRTKNSPGSVTAVCIQVRALSWLRQIEITATFQFKTEELKRRDQLTVQSVFPVCFQVVASVGSALFMPKANGVSNLVRHHMICLNSHPLPMDSNVLRPYTLPTSHQQL